MKKQLLALAATSTTALGLMGAGLMGATTVHAGGTPTFVCVNAPLEVLKIECIDASHNNILSEIDVNHVLTIGELVSVENVLNNSNVLSQDLNNNNILNGVLSGNQVDVDKVISDIQVALVPVEVNIGNVTVCNINIGAGDQKHTGC
jgi:hypothetical protein